jgi:hypothetical protein
MKILLAFRKTVSNSRVSSKTESRIKLLLYFLECPPLIGIQKNPQNVHVIGRSGNSYRITGGFRNNFRTICGFLTAATNFLKRATGTEKNFKLCKCHRGTEIKNLHLIY